MRAMKRKAGFWIGLTLLAGSTAVQAQVYVYPQKGQSAEQQQKDSAECKQWATSQSGVDPNAAPAGPDRGKRVGGAVGGAARGAAVGAAIGAIAGDAGKGAAIGAVGGGVGGRRGAMNSEQQKASGSQDAFNRAFGACMDGRGYSVK